MVVVCSFENRSSVEKEWHCRYYHPNHKCRAKPGLSRKKLFRWIQTLLGSWAALYSFRGNQGPRWGVFGWQPHHGANIRKHVTTKVTSYSQGGFKIAYPSTTYSTWISKGSRGCRSNSRLQALFSTTSDDENTPADNVYLKNSTRSFSTDAAEREVKEENTTTVVNGTMITGENPRKGLFSFFRRPKVSGQEKVMAASALKSQNASLSDVVNATTSTTTTTATTVVMDNTTRSSNIRSAAPSSGTRSLIIKKKSKRALLVKRSVQLLSLSAAILLAAPYLSVEMLTNSQKPAVAQKRHISTLTIDGNIDPNVDSPDIEASTTEKTDTLTMAESPVMTREEEAGANSKSKKERKTLRSTFGREGKSSIVDRFSAEEKRNMALSFVTEAVEKIAPSVVRIDTETHVASREEEGINPRGPAFVQQGQGSGVIFSSDGLILTNAHVIEDANRVTVTMSDGRVYEAEVKGSDEIVDIAVVKIIPMDGERLKLPVARLGDSDKLKVGNIVVAVGSAGGLDGSVTMGIVSGLERSSTVVGIPHKKVDYIQTDAAVNPGNSGGPLVLVETGDVIGINAAIRAHMEGTSFSIPINLVLDCASPLSEGKEIHHGYLGVSLATCTPQWAKRHNSRVESKGDKIPEIHGCLVHKVFPRTPADKGGLKNGDIVLEIGGEKIQTSDQARRLIDRAVVGKKLNVKVLRGNKQKLDLAVEPVDLATRLKEIRQERMAQMQQERLRFQELGPFPMDR